ncbi:MAG: TonB-dependent receptor [Prevotella sp.]|nr:TonB-dependent receptor [Prevotella sp.]
MKTKGFFSECPLLLCWAFLAGMPANVAALTGGEQAASVAVQQSDVTTGRVLDESGEPMIGVTVRAVGGKAAAVTDLDGRYSIAVPAGTMLVFSFTGYKDSTAKAGETVSMQPDVLGLDDVVVIGYGTQKKRDLTGAVTSMKNADVVIAPTGDVMEALQGKVTGLDITKTSGEIGSGVSILLRGSRSIYGDNQPLFIIDGLPGSYDALNPNDIESIDVLKDASATAIYGSAGANGVVIITTKRGSTGRVKVNFDAYYGFSGSPEYKKGMVKQEWFDYYSEAYKYKNGFYPDNINALMGGNQDYIDAYNNGKWIDWVDEVSGRTATNQKYSLSVTGGTERTKVYASLVYSQEKGLLRNEQLDKYALRLNVDQQVFDWAKVGFTSNLNYSIHDRGDNKTYTRALAAFPLGDAYDDNGNINHEYIANQYSPLADYMDDQYARNTRYTYVNAIGYLELTPLKGLVFRSQLNGTLSHSRLGQYWGNYSNALRPTYAKSPHASLIFNDGYGYNWENILAYSITVADSHDFSVTGVTSWQKNNTEYALADGSQQMLDVWQYWNLLGASADALRVQSAFTQTQKMSYAIRFNYGYQGKYLLTFSNRWDGVSFFSKGNKWDSFPAAAFAWRISDEAFMEPTRNWLDNLKLRIGTGITGNSGGVGAYGTTTQAYVYNSAGITIDGDYASHPFAQYSGTYDSPTLGWEKSYNWNFGLDFGLMKGRIDGSIDYFTTVTRGLLFKRTMPITTGATGWGSPLSTWENLAKTSNKGLELSVNSRNIATKDFNWTTHFTATWQRERIESLPNGDLINENLFVGSPIKAVYDYKYAGIWGTDASEEELNTYGVKPGWVRIETVEKVADDGTSDGGRHRYSQDDRQILGHENPNWILGLNNSFAYRGFDVSIYAMARLGQTISSKLLGYYTAKSSITENQLAGTDYWTENRQQAYYPAPGSGDEQTIGISSLRIFDGSFFKIKNITFGYTLPSSVSRHAMMEKCRFYFTAYNPWIICSESKLKGTDPEMGGSDSFPTYKQFVFGVNITF